MGLWSDKTSTDATGRSSGSPERSDVAATFQTGLPVMSSPAAESAAAGLLRLRAGLM